MRTIIILLIILSQSVIAKSSDESINFKEFKRILSMDTTKTASDANLDNFLKFKNSIAKLRISLPDGKIFEAEYKAEYKFINYDYIFSKLNINGTIYYNLTKWDSSAERFITWHCNQAELQNFTEKSKLKYTIGMKTDEGQYFFKTPPNSNPSEKSYLQYMDKTVSFQSTAETINPDGSVSTVKIRGIEKGRLN